MVPCIHIVPIRFLLKMLEGIVHNFLMYEIFQVAISRVSPSELLVDYANSTH